MPKNAKFIEPMLRDATSVVDAGTDALVHLMVASRRW